MRISHRLAASISAAEAPWMVSVCTCGRAFAGRGVQAAEVALEAHVQRVNARRQQLGELLTADPSTRELVAFLIMLAREE